MSEEEIEKLVDLIKDYEICIKEAEYEGNLEQKEGLAETKILLEKSLNYISKLQKELEEKTTIIMAGAEKVKQLEKENAELKEKIKEYEIGIVKE